MEPRVNLPAATEPAEWFVVFHRKSASRLFSALACGEFKHVSAFGYCAGFKAWIVYDVTWAGTFIRLVAHNDEGKRTLGAWTDDCDLIRIPRSEAAPRIASRLGLYCVSAVKHLLGLRCVAATPSGLYRHLLRNGGVLIDGRTEPATRAGRPEPASRAAAGAE